MRKRYSSDFKFRVALAVIRNDQTIAQICQEYEVTPSLVHKWRQQLLTGGIETFSKDKHRDAQDINQENEIAKLYEKIGQLTIERDFLKKLGKNTKGRTIEYVRGN